MGSEITDSDLEKGSEGVEGEDHYSTKCLPQKRIGRYIRGSKDIGRIVGLFRYCQCNKFDRDECENLLIQSTIDLPTNGLDIHRDGAGCFYSYDPKPRFVRVNGVQMNLYTYKLHCFCKVRSRTVYYER